ncbi:MAG TPA: DUF1801 domain-containing protein [Burkholderiaceae bacterium]|jgi:hypothetical protein|nr:DUF1801 domain-containing protein [Burkholderiaceae bacterium]
MTLVLRRAQQMRSLVATWFDFLPPAEAPIAHAVYRAVHDGVPDLSETIRQGNLLFMLNGEPVLAIASDRAQVQLQIFNGSSIEAEFGPLEGAGRRQRVMRFPSPQSVDPLQVKDVARASADTARRQQAIEQR